MRVAVLLADAAQSSPDGKASALGLGWTFTGSPTPPMSLVVLIDVDWNETNQDIPLMIDLVDEDGAPVRFEVPEHGTQGVSINVTMHVGRPPGHPQGVPIRSTQAFGMPPMPLPGGKRFQWRVTMGDEVHMPWTATFGTRPSDAPVG